MVVAILSRVVFAADVYDSVTGGEKSRVTGAKEGRWIVGGEQAEKVNGEGLISMEMATTGIN